MKALSVLFGLCCLTLLAAPVHGQAQRGGQGARGSQVPPAPGGRGAAVIDLTGYWVSLVTDDWRYRMLTPPKGNVDFLPVNAEARRVVDGWDPAKDEAAGEQCKAYGAVGVMRLPGRLHITVENENTLRVDIDTGTQTRVFHVGGSPPPSEEPTWQGYSAARWEFQGRAGHRGARARHNSRSSRPACGQGTCARTACPTAEVQP